MTRQKIAGDIVRGEIKRQGHKIKDAAPKAGMAKSTLDRVLAGDPTVGSMTLSQVEGFLKLPRRFLTYVIEGDTDRLRRLDGTDPDLLRHTLDALSEVDDTVHSPTERQAKA